LDCLLRLKDKRDQIESNCFLCLKIIGKDRGAGRQSPALQKARIAGVFRKTLLFANGLWGGRGLCAGRVAAA
jgi:hypothetical protein